MKRLVLTTTGTIAGLAALLSFKAQAHPLTGSSALPSLGTSGSTGSTHHTTTGTRSTHHTTSTKAKSGTTTVTGKPKTYLGSAVTTQYGVVQVKVTVAGGRITHVAFAQLTAFDGRSQQINAYAAPILLRETIADQSANVDTVSGASYTSAGYVQSLQSALDAAGVK